MEELHDASSPNRLQNDIGTLKINSVLDIQLDRKSQFSAVSYTYETATYTKNDTNRKECKIKHPGITQSTMAPPLFSTRIVSIMNTESCQYRNIIAIGIGDRIRKTTKDVQ